MGKTKIAAMDPSTTESNFQIADQIKRLRTSAVHAEEALDWEKAADFYNQALSFLKDNPENSLLLEFDLHEKRAKCFHNMGDVEAEISALELQLHLSNQMSDISRQVRTLNKLELCYVQHGDLEKATQAAEKAVSISRQVQSPQLEAASLSALCDVKTRSGEFEESERIGEQAIQLYRSLYDPAGEARILWILSYANCTAGNNSKGQD